MTSTRIDVVTLASQLLRNAYRGIEEAHHLLYPEASALVAVGDVAGLDDLARSLPKAPVNLQILDLRQELERTARILELARSRQAP